MKTLFTDIQKLYSFKGVAQKRGRHITDKDIRPLKKAALLVDRGQVLWLGPQTEVKTKKFRKKWGQCKKRSLGDAVVMPAFIDAHSHMVFGGDRKDEFEMRNRGYTYQEIAEAGGGIVSTVKSTRKATVSELLELARTREKAYLRQGVTTVEIKSGYGLNLKTEKKILEVARSLKRIRVVSTFLGAHAVPGEFTSAADYMDEVVSWLPKVKELAGRVDVFIEQGYFTQDLAGRLFSEAKKLGMNLCAHTDQLNSTGASLWAAQMGAQSVDHCVRLTDEEILGLAKTSTTAVLLPASDFYLRISYPPARRLIEAGVPVALATDFNPGSSPTQSINFTGVLSRLEMKMTLAETLAGFTYNAAQALGLEKHLGSLEAGKAADFICLGDDLNALFYEVGYHPVVSAFRQGRKVF